MPGVGLAQSSYDRGGKGVWQGEKHASKWEAGQQRQLGLIMFRWILALRIRVTELWLEGNAVFKDKSEP